MVTVTYSDDKLSAVKTFTLDDSSNPVDGDTIYSVTSTDDKTTETFYGQSYETLGGEESYNPDNDTVVNTENYKIGENEFKMSESTDFFGRTVSSSTQYKESGAVTSTMDTTITYETDDDFNQLNKVEYNNTIVTNSAGEQTYQYYVGFGSLNSPRDIVTSDYVTGGWGDLYYYDEAQQLTTEVHAQRGDGYKYTYDANGNITSRAYYTGIDPDMPFITSSSTLAETRTYTYDSSWSDRLNSYNGQAITYDSSGNPLTYKGATLTWQGRNLMSYTTDSKRVEYTYDTDGLRTTKKLYDSQGRIVKSYLYTWVDGMIVGYKVEITTYNDEESTQETHLMTVRYLYDESDEVYGFTLNEQTYYYVKDIFDNITAIINGTNGKVVKAFEYTAYGELVQSSQAARATDSYEDVHNTIIESVKDTLNSLNESGFFDNIWLDTTLVYKDYSYDPDIGMYYLQSRYYDPEIGRFINADDTEILKLTQGTINGANLFAYCNNDPVLNSDPSGKIPLRLAYAIAGAALFGGITYLIGRMLGIAGRKLAILTSSLAVLGAIAAAVLGVKFLAKVSPKLAKWFKKVANGTKFLPPNISKDGKRKLSLGGIVILDAFKLMFHPPGGGHNFFHIQIEVKIPGVGKRWKVVGRIPINPKKWFR